MPAVEPPSTSPSLLGRLAKLGAGADWDEFVGRYAPLIAVRCRAAGLQPADADDVRAEVFARLVAALKAFEYDPARRFRGYLRAAVDNAIRSHWRTLARRPGWVGRGGPADPPDPLTGLGDELEDDIARRTDALTAALDRVRDEVAGHTWQAFWLTAVEGLTGAEAAARLGMTPAAVFVAKSRALARVRAAVRDGAAGTDTPE